MKQILLLIWCLNFILNFVTCRCSVCDKYPELSEQRTCVNVIYTDDSNYCKWADKNVSYTVQQEKYGIVNIEMPVLATCNDSSYIIMLYWNRNVTFLDQCNQDFFTDMVWKKHSEIRFQPNSSCMEYENNNIPTIVFDYVFSGCYKIIIHNEHEGKDVSESYPIFIATEYKKQPLTDNDTITVQWNIIKQKILEVIVTVNVKNIKKPPSVSTLLGEMANEERNLKGTVKIDNPTEKTATFKQMFEICESFSNVTFNCSSKQDYYNRTVYICHYKGLQPAKYMFEYKLLDEYTRCKKGTLWAKPSESCEGRAYFDISYTNFTNSVAYENPASFSVELGIIISIVNILTLIIMCTLIFVRYKRYKYNNIKNVLPQKYDTLPTCDSRKILLIYTRETDSFLEIISTFKKLLKHVEDINIIDIYDNSEEINIDPQDWYTKAIEKSDVKIILFLNICSLIIYRNYPNITYRDEIKQDGLFRPAIKQLQISANRNDENLFVLQLSNFPEHDITFGNLPNEKKYIMPEDIQILLRESIAFNQELPEEASNEFKNYCDEYARLSINEIVKNLTTDIV